MDSNYGDSAQSWRLSSQAPLDAKAMVNRISDLTDLGPGNSKVFTYYRGMMVYCHETKKRYEWTDNISPEDIKLLSSNFIYPYDSVYDHIDYSGLEFNFIEERKNQGQGITVVLSNYGGGVEVYDHQKSSEAIKYIKTLINTQSIEFLTAQDNPIHAQVNEEWLATKIPITGGMSVGDESENVAEIYTGVANKLIAQRKVTSTDDSIKVSLTPSGSVNLTIPKVEDDSVKQYYVNANYAREGNGSIMRPYKTITKALSDIIGNGTIVNPQYPNSIIYLLSDVVVEQWEFDQAYGAKLENRLSVNTVTVTSADDLMRTITYNGNSSSDYPFSVKAVIDKDLQRPGANSRLSKEIRMTFNNVHLSSRTTFGVVYGVSYDGHGVVNGSSPTSYLTLKKVRISTDYKKDDMNVYKQLYNAGGGAVELYGQPVLGQSTIDNNSSSMLRLEGMGNTGVGTHNLSDLSFFTSANKAISLNKTTVDLIGITTLEVDTHRLPVNSTISNSSIKGGYAPKSGLNLIDIDSSYLRIAEYTIKGAYVSILEGNIYYFIGGYDSAFNMKHASGSTYSLKLEKVEALVGRFNYLLKVEGTTKPDITLKNNEWSAVHVDTMAFYQTVKGSDFLYVIVENSNIYNVKTDTISNIQLASAKTMVNGYPYSNKISFPSDTAAMTGGLIPGNEYYNHDKRVIKRIVPGEPA